MSKYQNIVIETLVSGPDDFCLDVEMKLRPETNIGWNICCGGNQGARGRKHSEETKRRISKSGTGLKRTQATKDNISSALTGIKRSDETRSKLSQVNKNRSKEHQAKLNAAASNISDSTRMKMSLSTKALYKDRPWIHPATNKTVWALACSIAHLVAAGFQIKEVLEEMCLKKPQIKTILKYLKSGWNPHQDQAYLLWLEEYKNKA